MKKLLLTITSSFCLALASYGFSVYSENFDSYAEGVDNIGSAGFTFGKKAYTLDQTLAIDATELVVGSKHQVVNPSDAVVVLLVSLKTWTDFGWAPDFDNNQSQRSL